MGSLVQDYFLETLEERDYFGREATFYGFIRDICWRKFSQLTRTAFSRPYPPTPSHGFYFRLRALKENRLEPDYFKMLLINGRQTFKWKMNFVIFLYRGSWWYTLVGITVKRGHISPIFLLFWVQICINCTCLREN